LDTPRAQPAPEPARGLAEPAHPVVDDAHVHTVACFGDQSITELLSSGIFVNDVALEVDELGSAGNPSSHPGYFSRPSFSRRILFSGTSGAPAAREKACSASARTETIDSC